MARSPEYPDLAWVEPRSWTNANRTSVQLIVIHDTEGSSHARSAEDGAAYDARRADGTSAHYFVDNTSVVQCVRTADQAHTARSQGNRRGIQYELCAKASFSRARWLDPDYGLPMLRRAAKQCARDGKKWGIAVRKLTPAQVADGMKGFCGHADITKAFPQDRGTHTDPGPNFPWPEFLDMVQDEMEDDVTKDELADALREVMPDVLTAWAKTTEGRDVLSDAVLQTKLPAPAGSTDPDGRWYYQSFDQNTYPAAVSARTYAAEARDAARSADVGTTRLQERMDGLESKLDHVIAAVTPASGA